MSTQDLMVLLADKITKHPETKNVGSVLVALSCIFSFSSSSFCFSVFHFAAFYVHNNAVYLLKRLLKNPWRYYMLFFVSIFFHWCCAEMIHGTLVKVF